LPDPSPSGSLHRRALARRLKELREEAGLSGRGLASELGWSQAKVSRGERGETMLPVADIGRWLRRCAATDAETTRLLEIAEEAAVEATAIRHLNRWGHARHQRNRIQRERTATSIEVYQPEVIPGLLSTPEYCRDLLLAIGVATAETVEDSVRARIERQEAIADAHVGLEAIVTETAIAWQPSTAEVSDEQLRSLSEVVKSSPTRLGIVPLAAMRRAKTCNAFVVLRWPDGAVEVDVESLTTESTLSEPDDVDAYTAMFAHQREHAVYGSDALAVIDQVRAQLS
jgi:transcriptional regulator with XRE-family HTH domain